MSLSRARKILPATQAERDSASRVAYYPQGPVPERSISANPGLTFCFPFCIYLSMHCSAVVTFFVVITVSQNKGSTLLSILQA